MEAAVTEIRRVDVAGAKTSEFGVTAAAGVATVLGVVLQYVPGWVGAIVTGAVSIAYTIGRTITKAKAAKAAGR